MKLSTARILIIDDNKPMRDIVRSVLQGIVAEVLEADGGANGLNIWLHKRPDLVIIDYEMPRVNGVVFTKVIREQERGGRTPILMMTGHGDADHVAKARAAGVDALIGKPITPGLLLERMAAAFASANR